MATANSIRMKEAETNQRKLDEEQRKNRRSEQQRGQELIEQREGRKERYRTQRRGQNLDFGKTVVGKSMDIGTAAIGLANDPWWYSADKQLLEDTARFPFGSPLGMPLNFSPEISVATQNEAVPGPMHIIYAPRYLKDAVTTAARNVYAFVRHANSGSANYDPQDLMMMMLGMSSIYEGIAWLKRVYSIILTAKGHNRYWPEQLLNALGIKDSDAYITEPSKLRYRLNKLIMRTNALYVPSIFPLYLRRVWMSGSIFKDTSVKKSQNYMFSPAGYYIYDEQRNKMTFNLYAYASSQMSQSADYNPSDLADNVIEDVFVSLETALDTLFQSESIGIMTGDIYKAYGEHGLVTIDSVDDTYHVEAVYSAEVLSQIGSATIQSMDATQANTVIQGTGTLLNSWDLVQDVGTGTLYQGFIAGTLPHGDKVTCSCAVDVTEPTVHRISNTKGIINMYKDDVSADDAMVASRLISLTTEIAMNTSTPVNVTQIVAGGTEVIVGVTTVTLRYARNSGILSDVVLTPLKGYYALNKTLKSIKLSLIADARRYFMYDWAPQVYGCILGSNVESTFPLFDVQNYYQVQPADLEAMTSVALYSMLAVPQLAQAAKNAKSK